MAEDLLQAEHIATVDEVAAGERVAERMGAGAGTDAGAAAEPRDRVLDAAPAEGSSVPADEQRCGRAKGGPAGNVAEERPTGGRADGHDPLLRALAQHPDRPVGPEIADAHGGDLGEPKAGVQEEQSECTLARIGERQETLELSNAERRGSTTRPDKHRDTGVIAGALVSCANQ